MQRVDPCPRGGDMQGRRSRPVTDGTAPQLDRLPAQCICHAGKGVRRGLEGVQIEIAQSPGLLRGGEHRRGPLTDVSPDVDYPQGLTWRPEAEDPVSQSRFAVGPRVVREVQASPEANAEGRT